MMLDMLTSSQGIQVVKSVIRELVVSTHDAQPYFAETKAIISAQVRGKKVISDAPIMTSFRFNGSDRAEIDIIWESGGYPNFQSLGLFPSMCTLWQIAEKVGERTIRVLGDTYEITIKY